MGECVVICGSRGWQSVVRIEARVGLLSENCIVVHGGARGADRIAGVAARRRGLHVAVVEPLWDFYGNSAGHKRNHAMLDLEPDLVIAFSLGTNGTQGTIDESRRRGIPVEVIGTEAAEPKAKAPRSVVTEGAESDNDGGRRALPLANDNDRGSET